MRKFLLSALLFISAVTHAAAEYPDAQFVCWFPIRLADRTTRLPE